MPLYQPLSFVAPRAEGPWDTFLATVDGIEPYLGPLAYLAETLRRPRACSLKTGEVWLPRTGLGLLQFAGATAGCGLGAKAAALSALRSLRARTRPSISPLRSSTTAKFLP